MDAINTCIEQTVFTTSEDKGNSLLDQYRIETTKIQGKLSKNTVP